jgi:hypothetical protein
MQMSIYVTPRGKFELLIYEESYMTQSHVAVERLVLLVRIRTVRGSNLAPADGHPEFSWFFSVHQINAVILPHMGP